MQMLFQENTGNAFLLTGNTVSQMRTAYIVLGHVVMQS